MEPVLTELASLTRGLGLNGFAVVPNGSEFVARCVGADGRVCDPTTWDTHPTPAAAVNALLERVRRAKVEAELGQGI